jgi:hypothetical protein
MGVDADCLGLWHFDGSLNSHKGLTPTFTRASVAYLEDGTQVANGQPRFEQGKFGQAVLVEEGTENKIATPTTFADWANLSGGAVLDNDGSFYPSQAKFARVTTTDWHFQSNSIPAANGQTWSVSYIARRGTGNGEPRAAIMIMNASNGHVSNINLTFSSRNIGGGWGRYEATFTINCADTGYIRLRFYVTATNGGYHDFALPQLEEKPYATSFTPGTRSPETLTLPTAGVLNENEFDITGWFIPAASSSVVPAWARIWRLEGVPLTGLYINGGVICFAWNNKQIINTNISLSANDQLFYSVSKSGSNVVIRLAKNGGALSTFTGTTDGTTLGATEILLGSSGMEGLFYNGKHDELRIDKVCRTDEEIAGWYKANAPFYSSEDMKQWPGYVKVETDGLKVYDSSDALRVLLGSWLSGAIRKYGLKIIGGEIYSSHIFTGEEGDDSYAYLGPITELYTYPFGMKLNGKNLFEIMSHSRGPVMNFYDPYYNERVATISPMDDYYGQGLRIQGSGSGSGESTWKDINIDGRWITVTPRGQFYVNAGETVVIRSDLAITLRGDTHVSGSLTKSGTLNYVEPTKDYGIRLLNALEGPELKYVDMGRAQLENGEATVYLDPILLQCIEPDTDLTPWLFKTEVYGEGEDIRVIEWGENYFKVKECNGGTSNRKFGWWFYATRINYAGIRLQEYVAGVV